MAAASTYTPIATTTLGSDVATYTFSSIPSTYTDLVLIFRGYTSSAQNLALQFNTDTSTTYSATEMYGSGTAAGSGKTSNVAQIQIGWLTTSDENTIIANINNYSNVTTYKNVLSRYTSPSAYVGEEVGLWRVTSAISSILLKMAAGGGNLKTGSTITLYGIQAA